MKSALLAGASGAVGKHCLRFLLESDSYGKVRVLVRKLLDARHPKLEQQIVQFDSLEDFSSVVRGEDVFSCLGTTLNDAKTRKNYYKIDLTYPDKLARLAFKNGAERFFIITSVGASPHSSNFYLKVKGEIEYVLSQLPYKALHIFRPSLIIRENPRLKEKLALALAVPFKFLMAGPFRKYRPLKARTIALAMTRAARLNLKGIHIYESNEIQSIANWGDLPR